MSESSENVKNSKMEHDQNLQRVDTAGSVVMTKELFEKLYLSPQNNVAGELRKTFANPTPLGLGGFLLALTPLTADFMGWRGAGGDGAASIGAFYFLGGLLAILAAVGEFILGNSFSMVLFGGYGGFFLAYGATLQPSYNAYIAYDPTNPTEAPLSPGFLSSIAFLVLFMGVFTLIMLICSLRTNIVFVAVFLALELAFCFVTASDFYGAQGLFDTFKYYRVIGGGFAFVACMLGWYLFLALMLGIVDFPIQLPVGDLSTRFKGASERAARGKAGNGMV